MTQRCTSPYSRCLLLAIAYYFEIFDVARIEVVASCCELGNVRCDLNGRTYTFTFREFLLLSSAYRFEADEIVSVDTVEGRSLLLLSDWILGRPEEPFSVLSNLQSYVDA